MANDSHALLRVNLKQLRLPSMSAEFEKLAREAASANESFEQYLLRLTELEVQSRSSKAVQRRITQGGFPVLKDFDTFDFSCVPQLNKARVLELALGISTKLSEIAKVGLWPQVLAAGARRVWNWIWRRFEKH